jgi:hypothetical protein
MQLRQPLELSACEKARGLSEKERREMARKHVGIKQWRLEDTKKRAGNKRRNEERSRGGWRRVGSEKAQEKGRMLGKIVRGRGERWVI